MAEEEKAKYAYPAGDFLSGFSEDPKNPCEYEVECQRMVVRGVEYLDEHPDLFKKITEEPIGPFDKVMAPMIDFMCQNPDNPEESTGQTGAMVGHTVRHAYQAKKLGWDNYIDILTGEPEDAKEA